MTIDRLTAALADRYRIERELGAGGMATVYLAEDLKHQRKVAVKVLRPELAAVIGAARFLAEIKTTANLQHPHILPLHDSGEVDGTVFYVMPFVEGETLRDRLNREQQLPIGDAIRLTKEVASALDYAHRKGIIHRDIKPENILLHEGQALVADFGIALAAATTGSGRMTETGMSLGTPHYMSPEQAMGERTLDARADVYALGCVLYEMLIGEPPFTGPTAQAIVARVLSGSPELPSVRRSTVPANVNDAVLTALQKLPADRFESARAFGDALNNPAFLASNLAPVHGRRRPRRSTLLVAAACAVLTLGAGAAGMRLRPTAESGAAVVKFNLASSPTFRIRGDFTHAFAVSRDGSTIVFTADSGDGDHLWVRRLDDAAPRKLDATGAQPAMSPDGQWVAFVASNHIIRKVRLAGGEATTVLTVDGITASLDWLSNDEIVFERGGAGLTRVEVNGGTPRPLTSIDSTIGETGQRRPLMLDPQRVVLFTSLRAGSASQLDAISLENGKRVHLGIDGVQALGLVGNELVYTRNDGSLMAVAFDSRSMRTRGVPRQLPERASATQFGTPAALSPSGTLVYQVAAPNLSRLVLDDGAQRTYPLGARPRVFGTARFSPDGSMIALVMGDRDKATTDVWVVNRASGEETRITRSGDVTLVDWSHDGRAILFLRDNSLWEQSVGAGAGPHPVGTMRNEVQQASVVPGKRTIVARGSRSEFVTEQLDGPGQVDTIVPPFLNSDQLRGFDPRVSPDGRWVAFADFNTHQVYVSALTGNSTVQISDAGGVKPVWGRDAMHLYYHTGTPQELVLAELRASPNLEVARRQRTDDRLRGGVLHDVARDSSLLINVPLGEGPEVRVVANWRSEVLRSRTSTGPK